MIKIGKIFSGWYGGHYEDTGLFETKKDAERGINCDDRLYELFSEYEGKKIKVTIEIVEE
jgi:hypothetical protein